MNIEINFSLIIYIKCKIYLDKTIIKIYYISSQTISLLKEVKKMIIGYVRVSTVEQNDDSQIEIMKKYNVERIYKEKVSAKDMNRKKLKEMLDFSNHNYLCALL